MKPVAYAVLALLASAAARAATPAASARCAPDKGLSFVCGPASAEDLVPLDGTPWLVASGLAEGDVPGHLQLIDTRSKKWQIGWPLASGPRAAPDGALSDCASAPEVARFSAHGLSVQKARDGRFRLVAVNHGGREAVEFFEIDTQSGTPVITWTGCVTMPADASVNSVVLLPGGGFLATKFYTQGPNGIATIRAGGITGGVLEWSPGKRVSEVPGTGLNGANGIEQSDNGKVIYVNEWGKRNLVRFDRRGVQIRKDVVPLGFNPDNLRWGPNGTLLIAGQRLSANPDPASGSAFGLEGWEVAALTPATLAVRTVYAADKSHAMQGVSVGVIVDGTLWVGPFRGDRVGYVAVGLPKRHEQ